MKNPSTLLGTALVFFTLPLSYTSSSAQTFERVYGGSNYEMGNWLCKTSDGGFILTGQSMSYGDNDGDIYIVKTNSSGFVQWEKHYGSSELDGGNCIIESPDGGYLVIGHTEGWGLGDCEAYILKISEKGDSLWLRTIGDTGDDAAYCGINSSDQTYLISGIFQDMSTLKFRAFLAKYDWDGNLLWFKKYGSGGNESGKCVIQTTDDGYVMAGYTPGTNFTHFDGLLLKTDINGNELWEKSFGSDSTEEFNNVVETPAGDLLLSGYVKESQENGKNILLLKTNDKGNELWEKKISNAGDDDANGLCLGDNENFLITGTTHSVADTSQDIYLMKLDENGNVLWEKYFGGSEMDLGRDLSTDGDGEYAITGIMTIDGNANLPLIKTDAAGNITGIDETNGNASVIQFYPNPVENNLTVLTNNLPSVTYHLFISDPAGKIIVNEEAAAGNQFSVTCGQLPAGYYIMKLVNDVTRQQYSGGFIKK